MFGHSRAHDQMALTINARFSSRTDGGTSRDPTEQPEIANTEPPLTTNHGATGAVGPLPACKSTFKAVCQPSERTQLGSAMTVNKNCSFIALSTMFG